MHRRGSAVREAILAAFSVIASAVAGTPLHAQTPVADSAAAKRTPPREQSVTAGAARISVYRQGVKAVRVVVRSDSGTFSVSADSAILATWADSAASLPDPPDTVAGVKVSFRDVADQGRW